MDDPDVATHERVRDLLDSTRERARSGDEQAATDHLAAVEAVADSDLGGPLADRIAFGCQRVSAHLGDDHAVATEYLRAMERLLDGEDW